MNGVSFWDVDLKMHVVFSKAEFTELKAETLQVSECLDTSIDVTLFSEISVSFVCGKHHGHPVIAGVTRNLFRAIATYNIHNFCISCRTNQRAGKDLPRATKKRTVDRLKMEAAFHLRVFHCVSDHAVFPVAIIIKYKGKKFYMRKLLREERDEGTN